MSITATQIRMQDNSWTGNARLYQLNETYHGADFIVVSALGAAFDTGAPETFIFKANAKGECLDWGDLPGSTRGTTDHVKVLTDAGLAVIDLK